MHICLKLSIFAIELTLHYFPKSNSSHSYGYSITNIEEIESPPVGKDPHKSEHRGPFAHDEHILIQDIRLTHDRYFKIHEIIDILVDMGKVHEQASMKKSDDSIG